MDGEEKRGAFVLHKKWGRHGMTSPDLDSLCSHINEKISDIRTLLHLRKIGQEPSLKTVLSKILHEMFLFNDFLNKMELECHHQERQWNQLKELQELTERDCKDAQHLEENMPLYLPNAVPTREDKEEQGISTVGLPAKKEEQGKEAELGCPKKPGKETKPVKEISFVTVEEFDAVPMYMRGRISCNQVNAVIQEINKAVASKYKIMRQPLKSMPSAARNLYFRFREEETKNTKGQFFIVEADIEEFTQLKADKRFHSILTILRHCQRVREIRGSKLVRYAVC